MVAPVQPAGRMRFTARLRHIAEAIFNARRKVATGAAAVLTLTVGYHVVFGQNGLTAYRGKRHDLRQLRTEMTTLQRENEQLHSHVDRLASDPNAIEHEAREELHYTRPGEVIYTMPEDGKQTPTQ